jgi:Rab-like protein 2
MSFSLDTHLTDWYKELQEFRQGVPCVLIANKIDADNEVVNKTFNFASKRGFELFFTSAQENTNIGKVTFSSVVSCLFFKFFQPFQEAIDLAVKCKENPPDDFLDDILDML